MVEETVITPKPEQQTPKKKNNFIKIVSSSILIILIIVLIVTKIVNPDFSTGLIVWPIIIMSLLIIIIIFGSQIVSMTLRREPKTGFKLPPAISDEDAFARVEKAMTLPRYADRIGEVYEDGSEAVGSPIKSDVYTLYFKGIKKPENKYAFIINKHQPEHKKKVLINPTIRKIKEAKNQLAIFPEETPDVEEITEENPLLGTRTYKRKTSHKEKRRQQKKVEDET